MSPADVGKLIAEEWKKTSQGMSLYIFPSSTYESHKKWVNGSNRFGHHKAMLIHNSLAEVVIYLTFFA